MCSPLLTSFLRHRIYFYGRSLHCNARDIWTFNASDADSIGHGGARPPLLQMAGHGGTVSRRTANTKPTKMYWPSRKRSLKRLIVLLELKKVEGHDQKQFAGALHCLNAHIMPELQAAYYWVSVESVSNDRGISWAATRSFVVVIGDD